MKHALLPIAHLCAAIATGQSPPGFQLVIDPPGDNAYHTFANGLVTPYGDSYVLGGYQNINEPAFNLHHFSASGTHLWTRKVTYTNGPAVLDPAKVVRAPTGGLFVFGDLGWSDGNGYFLTRMDSTGSVLWTRSYRTAAMGADYGYSSIVATSDGQLVLVMGLVNRTVAVRLNMDGEVLWSKRYMADASPAKKNPGFDLAATPDGGVLLTEKAYEDIFLVRIDAEGTVLWAWRYPNGGYCHTRTARCLEDGSFLIAGMRDTGPFAGRLNEVGQLTWLKEYQFDAGSPTAFDHAAEQAEGDILLTPAAGPAGIMALRVNPLGIPEAAQTIEGGGYASVLGCTDSLAFFGGRTLLELDGGFEDAILFFAMPAEAITSCIQGPADCIATDIPQQAPIFGCYVVDEPILTDTVYTALSAPLFGLRPLCMPVTGLPDDTAAPGLVVRPSITHPGGTIVLSTPQGGTARVIRVSSDGRTTLLATMRGGEILLPTDGWARGTYLLRVIGTDGRALGAACVVVD